MILDLLYFGFYNEKGSKRKSVLVVEDDQSCKPVLETIFGLVDDHAQLHWETSAETAMEALENNRFDLIVADYVLEGRKTGLDIWQFCREKQLKIPFLLMSSRRLKFGSAHLDTSKLWPKFLQKPFQLNQCRKYIEHALI
ncbi:response regulator [bacterium]|jgi:DNA-binding NtrC family response regulator|nr:response regulator [bacterium]